MNKKLNFSIKLSIFLILIFLLRSNLWIENFLLIFSVPTLPFQKVLLFMLPGAYILTHSFRNKRLKIHNIYIFLVFIFLHLIMENFAFGFFYNSNDFDLINRWIYIFAGIIFLNNTALYYRIYIIKSAVFLLLLNVTIVYISIFSGFELASMSEIGFGTRITSEFNINIVCDSAVFAGFLVYFLKSSNNDYKIFNFKIPFLLVISYISPLILFQSSRGSLFLLVLLLIFYIFSTTYSKFRLYFLLIPLMLVLISPFLELTSFNIFNRIDSASTDLRSAVDNTDGRFLQVIASYKNFISSPIIGVGVKNAAANVFDGISRSNFHYSQILASGGLLLFFVYFLFIFKVFAKSRELLLFNKQVRMMILFILILFIFRRPDYNLAVFGYLSTTFNHDMIKSK